ncbi:3-dehydroquinate synthase [Phycisphaerae bacterium RAS2]|nr:3-dehydroquinate synthase [Phycisphaerae bacterium RAS2]
MTSNSHSSVTVELGERSYSIHIGAGLLDGLGASVRSCCPGARQVAVVTDSNVGPLYADRALTSLAAEGFAATWMTIPAGESSKSLAIASELYDALAEGRHARDEPIIALGGGVVGDVAGFVAATWLRGVPLIQCPTTTEACFDASVGGKTAVNHAAGKNLIGAFHQPALVCIDTACLATLSDRDYRAGLAESVKHAIIADEAFLTWHEQHAAAICSRDDAALVQLVRRNCEIKTAVVAADEREASANGVGRAALNFGHTIGHALEAESAYGLRHGEAVALGMTAALELAVRLMRFPAALRDRVEALITALGLPTRLDRPLDLGVTLARLASDKKSAGGRVRFVLPCAIGSIEWAEPSEADVRAGLARLMVR